MAYALVSHVSGASVGGASCTSSAIDTSGASLLVMASQVYNQAAVISDSKGNTWTGLTDKAYTGGSTHLRIFYVVNPTVGTGHTFTSTVTAGYPSICVAAFSGADTSAPFDVQNGSTFSSGALSSFAPGSITPSVNDELAITGMSTVTATTYTVGSSYTITDQVSWNAGNVQGCALAYLIQTTAGATNPTWGFTTCNDGAAVIASFKPGTGGGPATWGPLLGNRNNRLVLS